MFYFKYRVGTSAVSISFLLAEDVASYKRMTRIPAELAQDVGSSETVLSIEDDGNEQQLITWVPA
jgi:hypothetical protein